jgi:6-phosphogluconolactonase
MTSIKETLITPPGTLPAQVADWLLALATAKPGPFVLCLSGGATPRRLYEHLAASAGFPWSRTHLFWGDERFVPHDDALSNYRMVHEALLTKTPIPPHHIHPIPTSNLTPDAAAAAYAQTLKTFYGAPQLDPARPLFDVTFLGLGEDGHTASLFPGTDALTERKLWAAAVIGAKAEPRITLTYPVLESSTHAAFLIQGQDKQPIFKRFRAGDKTLPAARLIPTGQLHIFADTSAAGDR